MEEEQKKDFRTALDMLNYLLETINEAASNATYCMTDAGKQMCPDFWYTPVFEFSEEDVEFMDKMSRKYGYDLAEFSGMLEEAKEEE